jgi:hypothetical protein
MRQKSVDALGSAACVPGNEVGPGRREGRALHCPGFWGRECPESGLFTPGIVGLDEIGCSGPQIWKILHDWGLFGSKLKKGLELAIQSNPIQLCEREQNPNYAGANRTLDANNRNVSGNADNHKS